MTHATPTFKKVVRGVSDGEKILPGLRAYMYDPKFPSFDVHIEGSSTRSPDGWFHPSTHPLWTERQLYYYMAYPQLLVSEPLDPLGTMATTAGNFWHKFLTVCGTEAGIFHGHDIPVQDEETRSRGEMDLLLADGEAGEIKSMNSMKMNKIVKGAPTDPAVIDSFRTVCPQYYAQAQEYLRLSGLRTMRFLILHTDYPFNMREFAVPYDVAYAMEIRDKYLRVLQSVADQKAPLQCCMPRSTETKECPAREVCPVGGM